MNEITVYVRRGCGFSQGTLAFLNALGVPNRTVNIDLDPEAMQRIRQLGDRMETPYVDFGDGQLHKMPTNQEVLEQVKQRMGELPPS